MLTRRIPDRPSLPEGIHDKRGEKSTENITESISESITENITESITKSSTESSTENPTKNMEKLCDKNTENQDQSGAAWLFPETFCEDPVLNARIDHLHTLARQGEGRWIQIYIDAYLPAVAYLLQDSQPSRAPQGQAGRPHRAGLDLSYYSNHQMILVDSINPNQSAQQINQNHQSHQNHQNHQNHQIHQLARKMVLSPADAPQLGTLPDLTHILRRMLLQVDLDQCGFVLTPLYSALPCIRRPPARKAVQPKTAQPKTAQPKTAQPKTSKPNTASQSPSPSHQSPLSSQSSPTIAAGIAHSTQKQQAQQPQCPPQDSQPHHDTHQVAICVLLGLLLGLYPTSVKFPPFPVRVALYRRVHALLTSGGGTAFCLAHPALLAMAMMEYCAFVIPTYLPVEHSLLAAEPGMQPFFSAFPLACDTFRQEALQTGEEPWSALEMHCAPLVERHSRACKSRHRGRQAADQFPVVKLSAQSIDRLVEIPFIVPYPIHLDDPTHCIMASEMAFLGIPQRLDKSDSHGQTTQARDHCDCSMLEQNQRTSHEISHGINHETSHETSHGISHEQVVALQRTIHAHQLPPNLAQLQLSSLAARMRVCERSALSCTNLYVCVSCVMANQQTICRKGRAFPTRGHCKRDFDSDSLLCSVCQSYSIVSISTLGRIVSLRNHRFYLAPCCATVQVYTGSGDEFDPLGMAHSNPNTPCPHARQARPHVKPTNKRRCELCSNVALPEAHASVDHLTAEQHLTFLCQRHTPHADSLKHVTNWRQLQEEIRKRDRPLFALRGSGRALDRDKNSMQME